MGEAAERIPMSFRLKYPDVPWSKMAGMRDVLIHFDMGGDLKIVWKVVQVRLPGLKLMIELVVQENRKLWGNMPALAASRRIDCDS